MVYNWRNFRHFLFSTACVVCGDRCAPDADLCPGCLADLPHPDLACPRCALPSPGGVLCGRCQYHPPVYRRTFAAFEYAAPMDRFILDLKFHSRLHYARVLGELLADALTGAAAPRPELIVPVPLHPGRLRRRGYNQALEIARPPARRFGIPLDTASIRRVRATPPQMGLSERQRRHNLRNAFGARRPLAAKRIALVDDVMTTGETVNEAARCLLRAGAETVDVWVVARA